MVNRVIAAIAVTNAVTTQPRARSSGPKSGDGRRGAGLDPRAFGGRTSVSWVTQTSLGGGGPKVTMWIPLRAPGA